MKKHSRTIILGLEVLFFVAAGLGIWYYRSLDNFSLERDEQGEIRDGEKFLYGPASGATLERGAELADRHCGNCHLMTEPSALPAAGWRPVLENMGVRLGMAHEHKYLGEKHIGLVSGLKSVDQYPAAAVMSKDDWRALKKYFYAGAAAKEIPGPRDLPISKLFQAREPLKLPRIDLTLVKIDGDTRMIHAGGMEHNKTGSPDSFLARFDRELKEVGREALDAPPVALLPSRDGMLLTTLGDPAGARRFPASVYRLSATGPKLLTTRDFRITRAEPFRMQADGPEWLVLSGFGALRGGLIMENPRAATGKSNRETVLLPWPGPIDTRVFDANGDGHEDIVALVAQDREGLSLFLNPADRPPPDESDEELAPGDPGNLLRFDLEKFHPAYGSTGLEAADYDGDGKIDLLVTNGDNADFPGAPVKRDHGLRMYRNESTRAKPAFREVFYFQMFGATRTISADFDGDGDPDIAAVALYAVHPEDRFALLENLGGGKFQARRLLVPGDPVCGVIDAGDLDGDGDIDLVLGALPYFSSPDGVEKAAKGPPLPVLYILENTSRSNGPSSGARNGTRIDARSDTGAK